MDNTEIWANIIKEDQKHKRETGWSYFEEPKKTREELIAEGEREQARRAFYED